MAFPTTELFGLGYPANAFFVFRQFKTILLLRELPGSVAGAYKWLLGPGTWPFWCFLGCFVAKTLNSHTGGAMTKPVAVFRSRVIEDSRHTVKLDENGIWCYFHLSASISPHHGRQWAISATWPVEASRSRCYRLPAGMHRVYGWLSVGYHVGGVSRPGRVGHSDPKRPSTGSVWRPISRTTSPRGKWGFVRWIGPLE
jgi:hypothetical protein